MKMLPPSFGPLSSVFGNDDSDDKLSSGITVGYPILRIKGKVWSITRGGNDPFILMRPNNDGPRNAIDVVLLAASQYVSKVYYERGYEEGSSDPPDCFSANGIVPDPSSPKLQAKTCAACPHSKWGSRVTPAGKKAKACADSKRVAVTPLGDIKNETFGGPMLLRVPATSLADFGTYGNDMDARGYKYWTIGTKIAFDAAEAYPKLVFEPIRPLNDTEAQDVLDLRDSEVIKAILSEGGDTPAPPEDEPTLQPTAARVAAVTSKVISSTKLPPVSPMPQAGNGAADGFGGSEAPPVAEAVVAPAAKPKTQQKPKAAAQPQPSQTAPSPEMVAASSFEASLDAQIEDLMPSSE